MRFFAFLMLGSAGLAISVDLHNIFSPGKWSWYRFRDMFADFGIPTELAGAPMTSEFMDWVSPASVSVVALCLAGFFWLLQPKFMRDLIADWR